MHSFENPRALEQEIHSSAVHIGESLEELFSVALVLSQLGVFRLQTSSGYSPGLGGLVFEVDGQRAAVHEDLELELLLSRLRQQLRVTGLKVTEEPLTVILVDGPFLDAQNCGAELANKTS